MLPETIQLEKLRQKIEDAEYESGSQSDYLDYGKPNKQQAQAAQENIAHLKVQSKEARAELHDLIGTVRKSNPEAFTAWIAMHTEILQRIMAETGGDRNAPVRKNVARETLQLWEKVAGGEQEYININWHFLKDYKAEVRRLINPNKAEVQDQNNTGKAWWQFWK